MHHADETLEKIYEHFAIVAVRDAAYFFAATVGLMLVPRVTIWMAQEFCTIDVVEVDEISSAPHLAGNLMNHR